MMNIEKEQCCANCAHFEKKDDDPSFHWSNYRYVCNFHKLYNGEVFHPLDQCCDQHWSITSKKRDDKLNYLLK